MCVSSIAYLNDNTHGEFGDYIAKYLWMRCFKITSDKLLQTRQIHKQDYGIPEKSKWKNYVIVLVNYVFVLLFYIDHVWHLAILHTS